MSNYTEIKEMVEQFVKDMNKKKFPARLTYETLDMMKKTTDQNFLLGEHSLTKEEISKIFTEARWQVENV